MADFAPARRAHSAGLANRIGREVVVEQEALLVGAVERVDVLLVLAGAERRHHKRLRLAAGKERGPVGAGQDADLSQNRTDGREVAPVDAALMVEDVPAHDLRLGVVERFRHLRGREFGFALFRRQRRHRLRLDGVDGGGALQLLGDRIGGAQIRFADLEHRCLHRHAIAGGQIARLLGGLFGEADDRLDDGLETRMAGHDRLQHRPFGQLPGLRFDHQNRVRRAGDDEVERGVLHLLDRRIEPDLALDDADARGADGAHERHAREGERRRGGDHRQNVRIRLEVIGEHRRDDLGLAAEFVGKERADRAVDEARHQCFALRRSPLALEVTARNPACGERLFLVVDGEGEKVLAGLGLLLRDNGRKHGRFAPAREHGAVSLTGDAAGLQHELAPAPVDFLALNVKHLSSSCMFEDAKACGPCRPSSGSSSARRRGAGLIQSASPRRSCHDARLSHVVYGRRPKPPPGRGMGRLGKAPRRGFRLSDECRGAR